MANLKKGAAVPAATESAIQNIAEVISYIDSHITKGRTVNEMKFAGKEANQHLSQGMAILRKALTKFSND